MHSLRANKRDFSHVMLLGCSVCLAFNHCLEYPLKCLILRFAGVCGMCSMLAQKHNKKLSKNQNKYWHLFCYMVVYDHARDNNIHREAQAPEKSSMIAKRYLGVLANRFQAWHWSIEKNKSMASWNKKALIRSKVSWACMYHHRTCANFENWIFS